MDQHGWWTWGLWEWDRWEPGVLWVQGACDGPGLTAPVWAQQLCAQRSLGLLLCMSGPVINDPQTLLFTPNPPLEAAAATAHLANGHTHKHGGRMGYMPSNAREAKAICLSKRALFQAVSNLGAMVGVMTGSRWSRWRLGGCRCVHAGSQLVRQLSGSDLWPLDSNLSSLPAQYCYNWQLMRPDMLSNRALNRTSIFPRHDYHFCSLSHITVLSPLLPCSLSPRVGPCDRLWKGFCLLMELFLIRQRQHSHMLAF